LILRRYWTNACQSCPIKKNCTSGKERRITRWQYEHVLEAVQRSSTSIPKRCVSGAKRLSTRLERSRPEWVLLTS